MTEFNLSLDMRAPDWDIPARLYWKCSRWRSSLTRMVSITSYQRAPRHADGYLPAPMVLYGGARRPHKNAYASRSPP